MSPQPSPSKRFGFCAVRASSLAGHSNALGDQGQLHTAAKQRGPPKQVSSASAAAEHAPASILLSWIPSSSSRCF